MDSSISRKLTRVLVVLVPLFLFISVSDGDENPNLCGNCTCSWSRGKKAANCRNLSFTEIPRYLVDNLQYIDFSDNKIAEIRREEFVDAKLQNVNHLLLKNCTIMELNRDAFVGLSILIELDLSKNLLRQLIPGTFSSLEKLRRIVLENNQLEYLPESLFNNLTYLKTVKLNENRIMRIEPRTFQHLPKLSVIELAFNNLTVLKLDSFHNISKSLSISLEDNPFNCDCHLVEFRNFAIDNSISSPLTACQLPQQLKGITWREVTPEQFACRPEIIQPQKGIRAGPFRSYVEAYNENVTLACRFRAAPKATIAWTYNKRSINVNDKRLRVDNAIEPNRVEDMTIFVSELTIIKFRPHDKGLYSCIAENVAGTNSVEIEVVPTIGRVDAAGDEDVSSNLFLIICIGSIVLFILLMLVVCLLCLYCRRAKRFSKDSTMSENALMASKLDKSQNSSMLEGSVITEMQKSLLTSVNPVEKPPRRTTDLDSVDTDDGHEIKKTLLDDTAFGSHDEETNSIALSDTTPRSRQTFVDDGHGTNLPPDLLSFQAKVPHSPSIQSSISNLPDNRIYGKSPLASPVYQHVINQSPVSPINGGIYGVTPVAFRTLQHPKNRNLALLATPRANNTSPFVPAPVIYSPVVMKQGYMTIPRKPRVPSWTPSCSTTLSEFHPTHSQADGSESLSVELEPVYDNLGARTTAAGNSYLNLTKIGNSSTQQLQSPASRYTMKDRPLPATPKVSNNTSTPSRIYEPIQELANLTITSDTEPLYGTARNGGHGVIIVPSSMNGMPVTGTLDRIAKIPPRPPPKPKKKISVTSTSQGSTSQLFEDEGEDGTEV